MKRKFIFGLLAIIIFAAIFIAYKFYGPAVSTPKGEFFYVHTGTSYDQLKTQLVEQGYINSDTWFGYASGILSFKNVKAGRYKMEKGMSIFSLVRMLRAGNQSPVNLVITRIRTREVLAGKTGKLFEFDSLAMINFLNNNDSLRPYGFDTNTVMAAALPLTYSTNWNTTPSKLFGEFNNAYKRFWTNERKTKADSLGLNPIQVTSLASIIEEETNKKSDKPNIASVYLNRIKQGMPLQADPTVKFALKEFGLRRILKAHLAVESPYNTYIHTGLPPGPICTPSAESIDAVLNVPATEYLFFVASSNFDGSHIFTTNIDDHLKYARLYQKELTGYLKRKDSLRLQQQ
jgi:UPF0755 protein